MVDWLETLMAVYTEGARTLDLLDTPWLAQLFVVCWIYFHTTFPLVDSCLLPSSHLVPFTLQQQTNHHSNSSSSTVGPSQQDSRTYVGGLVGRVGGGDVDHNLWVINTGGLQFCGAWTQLFVCPYEVSEKMQPNEPRRFQKHWKYIERISLIIHFYVNIKKGFLISSDQTMSS